MGVDFNHARFLLSARKRGVSFKRTIMLGRQFCTLNVEALRSLLVEFELEPEDDVMQASNAYAEPLLKFLGAAEIVSLDANEYQGASFVHDMNFPVPGELKCRFDAVVEGGTLEHIFNFPVAVQNCMEMLVLGGHFLGIAPANNQCGHGFYQFSPELFFRVFSPENGFTVERACLCEVQPESDWFEVLDPLATRQFVEFANTAPTYLLVQARKLATRPIFASFPEQSVYTMLWNGECPGFDRQKAIFPTSRT